MILYHQTKLNQVVELNLTPDYMEQADPKSDIWICGVLSKVNLQQQLQIELIPVPFSDAFWASMNFYPDYVLRFL